MWHRNNQVPDLHVFDLWEARASFRNLVMPPSVDALCRYGSPFTGGTIPIVGYEAGIGTSPISADVSPFQQVLKSKD